MERNSLGTVKMSVGAHNVKTRHNSPTVENEFKIAKLENWTQQL
jgi:hypothetical protein